MTKVSCYDVDVVGRDGKHITTLVLDADAKVIDLKKAFHALYPKYSLSRQYFTIGSGADRRVLKGDTSSLSQFGIEPSSTNRIVFKDLGPQVAWRTVFFVEYFGPILIHSMIWFFPSLFYSQPIKERLLVQKIAFALVVAHYLKRELETAFVHRFSAATMPVFNIFKNSFHYWILGGFAIAYFVYHPLYTPFVSDQIAYVCAAIFLVAMLCNLYCHLILMNLRPAGSTTRAIPKGFAFKYVSCPNYYFEIVAWAAFAVMSGALTAYLFLVVSAGQMYIWAIGKHKAYRKEFPDYPRSRKALIPFLV